MGKTILGYILGFTFSFVTIFEGMYVLSKVYPEFFRPVSKSTDVVAVAALKTDSSMAIAWQDTGSIGLEYVEAYKLDSLKVELERVYEEMKKYRDSVSVLYKKVRQLEMEVKEKEVLVGKLKDEILKSHDEKIKAIAKIYESMEPSSAARILENMPEDEAIAIILNMQRRQAAKILAEINARKAMQLTRVNNK